MDKAAAEAGAVMLLKVLVFELPVFVVTVTPPNTLVLVVVELLLPKV